MLFEQFRRGVNIGGWLSQFDIDEPRIETAAQRRHHFDTFLTQRHIQQIAGWGFDHVRLPVEGRVLVENEAPYALVEETAAYLDRCIAWCEQAGLNVIVDLHDIDGNIYGQMDRPIPLLTDADKQARFLALWRQLAQRFLPVRRPVVMFELFNEISDATGYLWRRLYRRAVEEIRAVDPERWILVGSNHANSVNFLPELDLLDDPLVFYNFHFYDPQAFTHQRAHFSEEMREYGGAVAYPGDMAGFRDYLLTHPQWQSKHRLVLNETRNDLDLMTRLLTDAKTFTEYSGKELYCGEYGVIDTAPVADAAAWLRDFNRLAEEYHFGRALWNYKVRDFGLLDLDDRLVHPELLEAIL